MKSIDVQNMNSNEIKNIFHIEGEFKDIKFSFVSINSGERLPMSGAGCHESDEYSYFIDGEIYTESGNDKGIIGGGMATLIPKGEMHWCENRSDKPCTLICAMVK